MKCHKNNSSWMWSNRSYFTVGRDKNGHFVQCVPKCTKIWSNINKRYRNFQGEERTSTFVVIALDCTLVIQTVLLVIWYFFISLYFHLFFFCCKQLNTNHFRITPIGSFQVLEHDVPKSCTELSFVILTCSSSISKTRSILRRLF